MFSLVKPTNPCTGNSVKLQDSNSLLRKIKKKPKTLGTKAKKRQEKGIKRALIVKEKEEIKIAKSFEKLNKKKHMKSIWE
jgi:hypothetical protein